MTASDAYRAGRALADLNTRHERDARATVAYVDGLNIAAYLADDEQARQAFATRVQVTLDRFTPGQVVVKVPGKGTPRDLPSTLHAAYRERLTHSDAVGPAAVSPGPGMSAWRLLDTPAGRSLAALLADEVPMVAELDEAGLLVARVVGPAQLLGATKVERFAPMSQAERYLRGIS